MTWVALSDRQHRRFSSHGLGIDRHDAPVIMDRPAQEMVRGTIMVETTLQSTHRPVLLFGYENDDAPAHRFFALRAMPDGSVACICGFGGAVQHVAVSAPPLERDRPLWVTFSWDSTTKWARLAIEVPGTPDASLKALRLGIPMFAADLRDAFTRHVRLPEAAAFAAMSNEVEPLGPLPGLSANTPIETPFGRKNIGVLRRGDLVLNHGGEQIPVLAPLRRTVPARGAAQPVRLRAPYFGLRKDIIVAATQSVQVTGADIAYAYGTEAVLVPAGHLVNATCASFEPCGPVASYAQVMLPKHDVLQCAGSAVDSIYVGRLRRFKEACAASLLGTYPRRDLPEYIAPFAPVLDHSATQSLHQSRYA